MKRPDEISFAGRLRRYFAANHDEYLTADDVALKLDCTRAQAMRAIETLRYEGTVETMNIVRAVVTAAKVQQP